MRAVVAAAGGLLALVAFTGSAPAATLPPPIASYTIDVRYDPNTHEARGHETIRWVNTSGEVVPDLQFHLYPNAFRNAKSSYLQSSESQDEMLQGLGDHWGYLDVQRVTLENGADVTHGLEFIAPDDGNPEDRTVARLLLPRPVGPGESIRLTVEFVTRFPRVIDRSGWVKDFVMAGQWFPKLGVYQPAGVAGRATGGWNCHQFHTMTEFFADFGDYDVTITVPKRWTIGATGARATRWENPDGTVSERWVQLGVHDFAWSASPRFVATTRTFRGAHEVPPQRVDEMARLLDRAPEDVQLPDVQVTLLAFPEERVATERAFRAVFAAIRDYGLWYGPYPYGHLTMVVCPRGADVANGMEYPTFFTGHRNFGSWPMYVWFESTFVHEFGHQYWYGLVASNEFEESWLDEGINTYSEVRVLDREYGSMVRNLGLGDLRLPGAGWYDLAGAVPLFGIYGTPRRLSNLANVRRKFLGRPATDDLAHPAWLYWNEDTYWVNSYQRPGVMLTTLERLIGSPLWPRVMRTYAEEFRFRHPTSHDFLATLNEVTRQDWTWYFDQFVWGSRKVDYEVARITNDAIEDAPGVYDRGGKRVTITAKEIERAAAEREKREAEAKKRRAALRDTANSRDTTKRDLAQAAAEPDTTRYRSEVRVRRLGDGYAPVDVVVWFSDRSVARESWDGRYSWTRFSYVKAARIDSVAIDSEQKLLIDVNRLNNFRAAESRPEAANRWAAHWMLWVQNFLQLVGWLA
jgi:hypothetical protein